MDLLLLVGTLLLTLLLCKVIHEWIMGQGKMKDIPGPKGWPLVGNGFQMDAANPHLTFTKWAATYGKMFKINLFGEYAIVLNDSESIHLMLNSEACSHRQHTFRIEETLFKDWRDITYQDFSPEWNERKKAITRSVNAYGTGLKKIESISLESIDKLFSEILQGSDHYRRSLNMLPLVHKCTAAIFTTLYYGRQLSEEEVQEVVDLDRGLMKLFSPAGFIAVLDLFPWMRHAPIKSFQSCLEDAKRMKKWVIEKHIESEQGSSGEDSQEGILNSLKSYVNKVTTTVMTAEELMGMTTNIILGGFVTSTASLYSLILVLINHPEIQDKMYEEIQRVTEGRRPKVTDRTNMTYIRAVMEEIFRFATVLPLSVPHRTGQDTVLNGKYIPEGTDIFPNIWMLLHDEEFFDEPWKFKPERYLNSDGQIVPGDHPIWKHSIGFSAGKRICPGEALARNRIFLTIASLLQKYKFLPEDDQNIPSCDPRGYDSGIVVIPHKFKVKVKER